MSSVMKTIGGKEVECFEAGNSGKMLLQLTGAFGGDTVRNTFMLVPMTMEEPQLEQLSDLWLTEQEKELGYPVGESCTSSSWWVGSNEAEWLNEVTTKYDHLTARVLGVVQDTDKLLSYGACGNSFYAIQQHQRADSASYFSLYVVDRQPTSMDRASIDNFLYANCDNGWSSAGSWDQVMEELQDFIMDMNELRHTVEQERAEDEKLPVNQVTLIRDRYSEDEIWSDVFWVDAFKTPAKELFMSAVEEFLNTPEGRQAIEDTSEDFNWGDAVMYVPEEIWNKHGIYSDDRELTPAQRNLAPTSSIMSVTIKVDQDEVLIPESYYEKDAGHRPLDNIIQSASERTGKTSQDIKSTPERDR